MSSRPLSYEPYTHAEILLDITLEELLRTEHSIRKHDEFTGNLMNKQETCLFFPCRMIRNRRLEAWELIRTRQVPRVRPTEPFRSAFGMEGWELPDKKTNDG